MYNPLKLVNAVMVDKKYKTRHLILASLFGKLKYNNVHFFHLPDSSTSVEQLATELKTTVDEILTAHHGLTKHIECDCSTDKHIISISLDGIDAFIDKHWLREGQKELNERFYDRTKWIVPVIALVVTIAALRYSANKTDRALRKVDLIVTEMGNLKNDIRASKDTFANKSEKVHQQLYLIEREVENLKDKK